MKGIIKSFDSQKKYGFILPFGSDEEIFFHLNDVFGDHDFFTGCPVMFNIVETNRGLHATNVIIDLEKK